MNKKSQTIVGLVLLILLILSIRSCSSNQAIIESQESIMEEQQSQIKEVTVGKNREAFEKRRAVADLNSLQKSYVYLEDSLKSMGLKIKDMRNALFLAKQTTGSGSGTIVDTIYDSNTDTVYVGQLMRIREPFFNFDATIRNDKSYTYNYTFIDSLSIVNTTRRKNIFSPWVTDVRVLSANKNTTLTGITSLEVKNIEPKFLVGISAGYGITNSGLSPFLGITVTKPIIKF